MSRAAPIVSDGATLVTPGRVGAGACDDAVKLIVSVAITTDAKRVLNEIVIVL
jgi:hypothetical protein